jgi:hypothetical protein
MTCPSTVFLRIDLAWASDREQIYSWSEAREPSSQSRAVAASATVRQVRCYGMKRGRRAPCSAHPVHPAKLGVGDP